MRRFVRCTYVLCMIAVTAGADDGRRGASRERGAGGPVVLSRVDGDHRATLRVFEKRGRIDLDVTRVGPAAPLAMEGRLELARPLVEEAKTERMQRDRYAVFLGEYPELVARLSAAAACSPLWNPTAGAPKKGTTEAFLKNAAIRAQAYPEVESFFASMGYAVTLSSVDHVSMCDWKNSDAGLPEDCKPPPRSGARVPCGAVVTFEIVKVD